MLDKNLEYIRHEINKDTVKVWMKSTGNEVVCPYSNTASTKVYSRYE
ncbi:hypothetical protein SH2C18_21700 [Clostridium sediminicola]